MKKNHFFSTGSKRKLSSLDKTESMIKLLEQEMRNPLFPMHTLMYLKEQDLHDPLIVAVLNDEVQNLQAGCKKLGMDELSELMIVAALFGSDKCIKLLHDKFEVPIDETVLNMAILSGAYLGKNLDYFTSKVAPSSVSLRYAIQSKNPELFKQLLQANKHFRLAPEHLLSAASVGNLEIFNIIANQGVRPRGPMILKFAQHYPEILARIEELNLLSPHQKKKSLDNSTLERSFKM